jgi:hypothetical protein
MASARKVRCGERGDEVLPYALSIDLGDKQSAWRERLRAAASSPIQTVQIGSQDVVPKIDRAGERAFFGPQRAPFRWQYGRHKAACLRIMPQPFELSGVEHRKPGAPERAGLDRYARLAGDTGAAQARRHAAHGIQNRFVEIAAKGDQALVQISTRRSRAALVICPVQ